MGTVLHSTCSTKEEVQRPTLKACVETLVAKGQKISARTSPYTSASMVQHNASCWGHWGEMADETGGERQTRDFIDPILGTRKEKEQKEILDFS